MRDVGTIFLLALAAAVYPQLLAVVVVILTRPNPQLLLWTCYLSCMVVSVAASIAVFLTFRGHHTIAGTSENRLGPAAYIALGVVALLLASLLATSRGRDLLNRVRPTPKKRRPDRVAATAKVQARAQQALGEGSLLIAALVGALLAVPGPFDLIALGRLARAGDRVIVAVAVMFVFALIKFILIEVPIGAYTVDPQHTAARVARFSAWMRANKLVTVAAVVGVVGLVLIGQGLSRLH
jgi:hypothetical protein